MQWSETENKLEAELLRRQKHNEAKVLKIRKVLEENEEIRQLKQKISRAYLNKHHAAQMSEKLQREREDLVRITRKIRFVGSAASRTRGIRNFAIWKEQNVRVTGKRRFLLGGCGIRLRGSGKG